MRGPAGAIERAYERLGSRYPRVLVTAVPQLAYPTTAIGTAALALFVDMSLAESLRIVAVGLALTFVYNLVYVRSARRFLEPLVPWLEGRRDQASTVTAWKTCAAFPREMMWREWTSLRLGGLSYGLFAIWTAFVAWQLDLPAYAGLALFVGAVGAFALYAQMIRFFLLEWGLRPVLVAIARDAAEEVDLFAAGPPLRSRLLAALPAINVVTGVAAVGVVGQGHGLGLADLGLAVVVSAVLAGTISFAVTLLLSDSITVPLGALHQAAERIGQGEFATRVPVVTTDETGALTRSFNQMAAGLEQRERLREAFGTFVDPALTERVLEEGTDLAGDEVELSLLFMDVRGFTTYAENAEPRDVVARLNDLYGQVVPAIVRNGGHANKFIGDGLLAVFGAPERLTDHADRAVAAALEVARLVRDRYGGELRVGIGVNSGTVVVGTIGGGGRLDFTVIGDAVNTAARVEAATRQTDDDVLITAATRQLLSADHGSWDERPAIPLKGKREPVRLFGPRA